MATSTTTPRKRRKRSECVAMPVWLDTQHLESVLLWPLSKRKVYACSGQHWTDCLVHLVPEIRLGGRYNARRVRYAGGVFSIVHLGVIVPIRGEGALRVLECVSHLYGVDAESDAAHNALLKGY